MAQRLHVGSLTSIGVVDEGDNAPATILLWKRADEYWKRTFTQEQRDRAASKGQALPDGSFPIANRGDLRNAIQSFGRAKNKPLARKHIIRRARALGAVNMLPDAWEVSKIENVSAKSAGQVTGELMTDLDLSALDDETQEALAEEMESLKRQLAAQKGLVTRMRKAAADPEEEDDPLADIPEPVAKAIADRDSEIEALRKASEEYQEKLSVQISKARQAEFVAKAEPFTGLLGDAVEVGPVLEDIESKAPEAYEKLEPMLTAASQRADMADLFGEKGRAGDTRDAIAKRDAWVAEARETDTDTPKAELEAQFWREHPEARQELREA